MKTLILQILFLITTSSMNAQLTGTIYDSNKLPLPGTKIKFNNQETETDVDGKFTVEEKGRNKKGKLLLQNSFISGLSTEIDNFPIEEFHNLQIYMLSLKRMTEEELKTKNLDNEDILHDVCLCYSFKNNHYYRDRLEGDKLIIILDDKKYEITAFQFDVKKQCITVDWDKVN